MNYRDWMREGEDVLRALPTPTEEEDAALALELARENAEGADPYVCPLCGGPSDPDERDDEGRCRDCQDEATRETYASVHPRPEEVG